MTVADLPVACSRSDAFSARSVGLPTIAARNTALFGMAGELPPIIISDLFGVHRNTATQWAALAQDSWAGNLDALKATE